MIESQGIHVRRQYIHSRDVLCTKHKRMGDGGSLTLTDCMYDFNECSLKKAYKPGAESHSREGFNFLFFVKMVVLFALLQSPLLTSHI